MDLPKGSVDDATEALIGECEDRGVKLQRDFNTILKEHALVIYQLDDNSIITRRRNYLHVDPTIPL